MAFRPLSLSAIFDNLESTDIKRTEGQVYIVYISLHPKIATNRCYDRHSTSLTGCQPRGFSGGHRNGTDFLCDIEASDT